MTEEERIKKYYEELSNSNAFSQLKSEYDKLIKEWETYSTKISSQTLKLDEYCNLKPKDYLCHFLETKTKNLGRSKGGFATQYMVKLNSNGTYHLQKWDATPENVAATKKEAEAYYDTYINPLLKELIECAKPSNYGNLEKIIGYGKYIAKQVLHKIMYLESQSIGNFDLLSIYRDDILNDLCNKFGVSGSCWSEKSKNLNDKLCLIIGITTLNAEKSYYLWRAAMDVYDKPSLVDNETVKTIAEKFDVRKQIVLTGAPGTGKTYSAKEYVCDYSSKNSDSINAFVQFHPSYDYTDFVEGLRPVILKGSTSYDTTFVKLDGQFKKFCRAVIGKDLEANSIQQKDLKDFTDFKAKYEELESDFDTKHFFIIDEINRADLSKVFGELMLCLEESYRGINNPVNTQYSKLPTYEIDSNGEAQLIGLDYFEEGFFIPQNIYIIGTMNDIDRSVEAFDFALRRRFDWVEIKTSDVAKDALMSMKNVAPGTSDEKTIDELVKDIKKMNEEISKDKYSFGLNDSYQIGHAYFKNIDLTDVSGSKKKIFENNIKPILKEYSRGRNKSDVDNFIEDCRKALGA